MLLLSSPPRPELPSDERHVFPPVRSTPLLRVESTESAREVCSIAASVSSTKQLELHQVYVIYVERLAVLKYGNNDGQPDGGLGGCDDHHEEDKYLPVELAQVIGERHERKVYGI